MNGYYEAPVTYQNQRTLSSFIWTGNIRGNAMFDIVGWRSCTARAEEEGINTVRRPRECRCFAKRSIIFGAVENRYRITVRSKPILLHPLKHCRRRRHLHCNVTAQVSMTYIVPIDLVSYVYRTIDIKESCRINRTAILKRKYQGGFRRKEWPCW